jgi:hypothetical protein
MANTNIFDAKFKEALPLYEKLKNEWNRNPPNIGKTDELLNALKVIFSSLISIDKLIFFLLFRIYLLKVDFIRPIQVKIHVVYILHVCFIFNINFLRKTKNMDLIR